MIREKDLHWTDEFEKSAPFSGQTLQSHFGAEYGCISVPMRSLGHSFLCTNCLILYSGPSAKEGSINYGHGPNPACRLFR